MTEFNLSFHPPHKDTCKMCDTLKVKIDAADTDDEKRVVVAELELHHRKAEKVRQLMRGEKEKLEQDQTYEAFTFDLEKTLQTPCIPTGIVYYKRQL